MATQPEDPVERRAEIREEIASETGDNEDEDGDVRKPTPHGGLSDDAGSSGLRDET